MSTNAFDVVQSALNSYNESWQPDHAKAMACRDLEDWLIVGIGLFDAITTFDERHQLRVFSNDIPFDADHASIIKNAYRWWLGPCDAIDAEITQLEKADFEVDHAQVFRSKCREAKGILTEDAEFFNSEALIALRDEAIDEHRAGNSLEFGPRQ